MNLLPAGGPERRRSGRTGRRPSRARNLAGGFLFGLAVVAVAVDVRLLRGRLEGARSEREQLRGRIAAQAGEEERLRAEREHLAELREVEARLARWDEERFLVPGLLREISLAVPDEVVLEEVRRDGPDLRITGRGDSAAEVARALEALSQMERVRDLALLWVEQSDPVAEGGQQRFALAGALRYASREPSPFERVEPARGNGGAPR